MALILIPIGIAAILVAMRLIAQDRSSKVLQDLLRELAIKRDLPAEIEIEIDHARIDQRYLARLKLDLLQESA